MAKHDEMTAGPTPPAYLPRVPRLFWSVHPDFETIELGPQSKTPAALERLGPPPFPKTGFPFIGFLATVYDHVAAQAGDRTHPGAEGEPRRTDD